MRKVRFLLSRLGVLAVLIGCGIAGIVLGFRSVPMQSLTLALQAPIQALNRIFIPSAQSVFGKSHLRILLVGLDYDYDALDQETSKSARSDILMAMNLDLPNHRIAEVSIPRDMVATLPNGQQAKINQAQSDGGVRESEAVVAKWLGIAPFDRYIVLRINTAKDLINAFGGIDVTVKNSDALRGQGANGPLDYDDNWGHLHVHLKPGLQHLDGDHAVGYARFRHDWCSDPCRIMRQQQIMHALVDKIERNQFNTFLHLQNLVDVARHDVDTNLTTQEELALAMSFAHLRPQDMRMAQVPYVDTVMLPDYGDSLIPDEKAKQQLVATLLSDTDETQTHAIRVCVENGTAIPGLAARIGGKLRAKGFTISELRNAPRSDFSVTEIHTAAQDLALPQQVKNALGESGASASILASSLPGDAAANQADVTVVVGKDMLGAP